MEELAVKVGCTKPTIYKYEHGIVTSVPYDRIVALADALSVSPGVLVGWEARLNVDNNANALSLDPHEEEVILTYRSKPELQRAVDILLGIEKQETGSCGAMAN